jgi:hypothetical protein
VRIETLADADAVARATVAFTAVAARAAVKVSLLELLAMRAYR